MKTSLDCLPCFVRQSLIALDLATDDLPLKEKIVKGLMPIIQVADLTKPPAFTTSYLHAAIRRGLGRDPFREVKARYNGIAQSLLPSLREHLSSSENPLRSACRLAIAGNIIDFGLFHEINLDETIRRAIEEPLYAENHEALANALAEPCSVLYLCDNAGEIVFDRLLIELLVTQGHEVTAVVKGGPVINDATMEDALMVGLPSVCHVIDNGSDGVGTVLEWCSEDLRQRMKETDLVISKGQANYETLAGAAGREIFYLFQAKCAVLARELSAPLLSMFLLRSA